MTKEPRTASEILLALESKIDQLIGLGKTQDLMLKVLSNKLNNLINDLAIPEGNDPNKQQELFQNVMDISSDFTLPVEDSPVGFRRTSRPETFENGKAPAPVAKQVAKSEEFKFTEYASPVVVPPTPIVKKSTQPLPSGDGQKSLPSFESKVPVMQRIVDKNGKAVFLAEVEIFDEQHGTPGQTGFKTRTNGVGKWQASLTPGNYKVTISKSESLTKEKINISQHVVIDGLTSTVELPVLIIQK